MVPQGAFAIRSEKKKSDRAVAGSVLLFRHKIGRHLKGSHRQLEGIRQRLEGN